MAKRKPLEQKGFLELQDTLDKEFSMFIRMTAADDNGYVCCPTCGVTHQWNSGDIHCSHFYGRKNYYVRWDERNVIAQCGKENRWDEGNKPEMVFVLIERWGLDEILEMRKTAKMPGHGKQPDTLWMCEKIREYKARNKRLREEKGL